MKTLLTTLNAKYIHKALSLRLLYVSLYKKHNICFKEFTIKDKVSLIVNDIIDSGYDVVCLSTYIWNVDYIKEVCSLLKEYNSNIKIILGGPEVSYDVDYFLDRFNIDYIISGEGEVALDVLLECIENNIECNLDGVSSKDKRSYVQTKAVDLGYIESLDSPYVLEQDMDSMEHRILYFETSRGCPYRCQYCLSSLEKGLRFYSIEYIKKQLDLIYATNVKTIKFLDRSFNAKSTHALEILSYIISKSRNDIQCQFEINGDVLDQKIIDYMHTYATPGVFRYEIGIQSTYDPTNEIVQRKQDFNRLKDVIVQIQNHGVIDLHLDLIAGLPLETLERFSQSFDDVFAFLPHELQLGFLKLLRGTSLKEDASKYGYIYQEHAPYELIESNDLTKKDIEHIHLAEDMLEKYWNSGKCRKTMLHIMQHVSSPFYFFLDFGLFYKEQGYKVIHYQNDELFLYLYSYCLSKDLDVLDLLIEDYLLLSKTKPKIWWKSSLSNQDKKDLMKDLIDTYQLDREYVFRYGFVERLKEYDLIVYYKDFKVSLDKYNR